MVEEKQLQEQLGKLRADEAQLVEALYKCRGAMELCEFLLQGECPKLSRRPNMGQMGQKPMSMAELGSMIGAKVSEPEPIE